MKIQKTVLIYAKMRIVSTLLLLTYSFLSDAQNVQHFDHDNSIITSEFDMNTATNLTRINGSAALISKKDGVAKLQYVNGAYTYSPPLLNAEGNAFGKGVVINNKSYTLNTVANGLEVFDNNTYTHSESIRTAYQVHHIAANSDGTRLYFYNKLNAYNTGLYAYNTVDATNVNLNMDADPNNNIETAIGDVVYNSFQDQFLVSEFTPGSADITVLNADDNSKVSTISISGEQFAKEMFISPQGRLYVTTNMQSNPGQYPKLCIYDATSPSYSLIQSISLSGFDPYYSTFSYYFAHFDYNPYDEKVYATVTVQEQKLLPYNTEPSTVYFNEGNTPITPPGKLLVLSDDLENEFNLANYPYKVVCPDHDGSNSTSQYKGNLFVVGEKLYRYDYLNPPANSSEIAIYDHHFIDMAYSKVHDRLFAVKEATITSEHRRFEIWTIDVTESGLQIEKYNTDGMPVDGQIANIFANPYDGRIYVYRRIDAAKLGDGLVALYSFDPVDANGPAWDITPLGIASYFPDYDHTRDLSMFFMTNITTPYINPYTNTMYLPNGGHSSVSKVEFEPNESLLLNPGEYSWLSFPRLTRTANNAVPVNEVLFDNIDPEDYIDESELVNLPPTSYNEISNFFSGTQWPSNADLTHIQSTLGYKLKLLYNYTPEKKQVQLHGNVLSQDEPLNIYKDHDNWVGYWLYTSQSPFDAFPENVLDELTVIKAQTWCCVKRWELADGMLTPHWLCAVHKDKVTLDYGDMVILETNADLSFKWQNTGIPFTKESKMDAQYYSFTEEADYISFFIELDSTENPKEVGAFIGETCIGATTVWPEDTVVLVPGYAEGMSGEVVFKEYYDDFKSANAIKSEYLVADNTNGNWNRRTIHTHENQSHYFISFGSEVENWQTTDDFQVTIYPNPANNWLYINYRLDEPSNIEIQVIDGFGRQVATLLNNTQPKGDYAMQWNLTDAQGKKLTTGIYVLNIKESGRVVTKKLVIY